MITLPCKKSFLAMERYAAVASNKSTETIAVIDYLHDNKLVLLDDTKNQELKNRVRKLVCSITLSSEYDYIIRLIRRATNHNWKMNSYVDIPRDNREQIYVYLTKNQSRTLTHFWPSERKVARKVHRAVEKVKPSFKADAAFRSFFASLTSMTKKEKHQIRHLEFSILGDTLFLNLTPFEFNTIVIACSRLRVLIATSHYLTDLSSFSNSVHLTCLSLECCLHISDITPLTHLTALTHLTLKNFPSLTDVSQIRSMTQLKNLNLSGTKISDLAPIASLTQLVELDLSANYEIKKLDDLTSLQSLQILRFFCCNGLTNIQPLNLLGRLTFLDVNYCHHVKVEELTLPKATVKK